MAKKRKVAAVDNNNNIDYDTTSLATLNKLELVNNNQFEFYRVKLMKEREWVLSVDNKINVVQMYLYLCHNHYKKVKQSKQGKPPKPCQASKKVAMILQQSEETVE